MPRPCSLLMQLSIFDSGEASLGSLEKYVDVRAAAALQSYLQGSPKLCGPGPGLSLPPALPEGHPDQCQGPESVAGGVSGLTGGFLGARPALELRLKFRVSGSLLQQPVGSFRRLGPALGLSLAAECPKARRPASRVSALEGPAHLLPCGADAVCSTSVEAGSQGVRSFVTWPCGAWIDYSL
ncbi:hypothetical protein CB1_001111023 [Camelus ferus]|nr:hypothetical protein CB1_001111023 [Camelus ferus]